MIQQRKSIRILFDEYHSESWSVSKERAAEIQPENPANSSYQLAANSLTERDFSIQRNLDQSLNKNLLSKTDVLVLVHPCDPKWEKTTSQQSPRLSDEEIRDIQNFVEQGGGLLIISEYEHDKYGNNLNVLLQPFGLQIENTTVVDEAHCLHENSTWILGESTGNSLSHLASKVCFYRAASCVATGKASIAWQASEKAMPSSAGLIGISSYGEGRVVVVTDSSLFGDRHVLELDHRQLWLNLMYWCAAPAFRKTEIEAKPSPASQSPAWLALKTAVNEIRLLQQADGSVPAPRHGEAQTQLQGVLENISKLGSFFSHQAGYLQQLARDLEAWRDEGFQKPDFTRSLAAFNPQLDRVDQVEHLAVFPLYTPNASRDTRFEALILRTPWPEWLAYLERTSYPNDKFVPGHLVDFTEGYRSECAVLFPETVSILDRPTNHFGVIFCDREALRFQSCAQKAAKAVHLECQPDLEYFLHSLPLIQDAMALWDLIHDKSHSVGELPFDPFMIRQRSPFWMYGLEELRVDLRSFCEADKLAHNGFPFARYVTYAILFDRIFRFPITGSRIRNYDALGGQLLFSWLHQRDVLIWSESCLKVRWDLLPAAVNELREKIVSLYKHGADCSRLAFWIAGHDLISSSVEPNIASKWKKEARQINDESDPQKWISLVQDDEFPLGSFHVHLLKKISV